ncbi:chloromuconate cycloisomerase [Dictyobacter vulcani]|uniref:o-succinylbenzoate synthase n=2 Tax=Dictyobacter vulcani TaxID=2607529 RepID=A0A5J4KL50_9CHLR|nr:chloromuconate cycloisomerase [Dictyobacter vulcani]
MPVVHALRWDAYRIPLPASFTSAHEELATRQGFILTLQTSEEDIIGLGECAPLPKFSGGTIEDARASFQTLPPLIQGQSLTAALELVYQQVDALPTTVAYALETALLDALGHYYHCSLGTLLALPTLAEPLTSNMLETTRTGLREQVAINTVVGAQTIASAGVLALQAVTNGYTSIKLKVGADIHQAQDLVAAVRATIGPGPQLRLDANEAWTFEQARTILTACEPYNIQYVEQPLARTDLPGMAALRRLTSIPIAADEVLSDLASARLILEAEAADILVIKPQLAGGLRNAQQIIQQATAAGIQCVITSTIESGIGVASALHLAAASPEIQLACGLATLPMLADDLIIENLPIHQGCMTVPTAPGLGVHLDQTALTRYT